MLQLNAVRSFVEKEEDKRGAFLDSISKKIFQILSQKRTELESSGFVPGNGLPTSR